MEALSLYELITFRMPTSIFSGFFSINAEAASSSNTSGIPERITIE
jgi:hypothetical protein